MLHPVSERTYARIEALRRRHEIAGVSFEYCPCRLLPETVLSLKTMMRELHKLWEATLGHEDLDRVLAEAEGARFFAGEVRLVTVQEGRPEMVAVWVPIPPDYPRRLKVQLVDMVEPWEQP